MSQTFTKAIHSLIYYINLLNTIVYKVKSKMPTMRENKICRVLSAGLIRPVSVYKP